MNRGLRNLLVGGSLLVGACSYVTEEDGRIIKSDIAELKNKSSKLDQQASDLRRATADAEVELKKLRTLIEQAQTAIKSSADLGTNMQKMQADLAAMAGRVDDLTTQYAGLSKSFTEYRAQSDVKIEQVTNAQTNAKTPPIPEKADDVFAQAQQKFNEKSWNDARRLFDAFLNRFPQDPRAAKAQYLIGDSYLQEQRYANAIGAFTKLIDNFPKSEIVPDAMFKNGTAFYALKYCGDARIYFQELLRRYPRTEWKQDANEQLKKLTKDIKNKAVCQS